MLEILIGFTILVGLFMAILLYKTAHVKKEVIIEDPNAIAKGARKNDMPVPTQRISMLQEKVSRVPAAARDPETLKEITRIVAEEAQAMVKDMRQEFEVKYQVAVQEKDKEVEKINKQFRDVKKQFDQVETAYKKIDEEKKTTDMVVKSIADGLVIINKDGEVLLMNPSAEKILGVDKSKKIGKKLTDNISDELLVSLAGESSDKSEKVIEFKSKNENVKRVLRSSSAVIQNEQGQTVGMMNVLTDVTKQRELDELKGNFISNITHEFRTPIVAMQKAIAVLSSQQPGILNDAQNKFLTIVSRNLVHLNRLVEDLLDMSRIDSGKLLLRPVPSRIERIVNEVCDTLDTWAKSKGILIVREIDKSLPEISCDPDKITQVLNNLIGNAIKFTREGRVTVKTCWHSSGSRIQIQVTDTGPGIAKENMGKLFRRFEQFGDQTGIIGTGLGLSITKEIVEKHGGEISAASELGNGSCFTVTLPLQSPR